MTFGYPMSDMVFRSHIEGSQVAGVSLHVKCQPLVIDNNVFSFEIWIFKICKSSWWELSHMACNTSDVELMMPAGPRSSSVIRLDKVTFHLKWLVTRAINNGLGKKKFFFKTLYLYLHLPFCCLTTQLSHILGNSIRGKITRWRLSYSLMCSISVDLCNLQRDICWPSNTELIYVNLL